MTLLLASGVARTRDVRNTEAVRDVDTVLLPAAGGAGGSLVTGATGQQELRLCKDSSIEQARWYQSTNVWTVETAQD